MKSMKCSFCGHVIKFDSIPDLPFVECERCGMRASVSNAREHEPLEQCPRCAHYIEKSDLEIHMMVCTGVGVEVSSKQHSSV